MNQARRGGDIRRSRPKRRYHDRRDDEERRQLPCDKPILKILVTGDRDWDDIKFVHETLRGYRAGTILVHGACRGADVISAAIGQALGFEVRSYPADWDANGKKAGRLRNQEMLDKEHTPESPIDLVIAFHRDIEKSKGTKHMLSISEKAGIACELYQLPAPGAIGSIGL